MSFGYAHLPDHVVRRIIQLAAGTDLISETTWHRILPLLSVCHSWRTIAAEVVHASVLTDSHADLIISTANTHLARRVHVSIDSKSKFDALIRPEHPFHLATTHWPNVDELRIVLQVDLFNRASNGALPALEPAKVEQLAMDLAIRISHAMSAVTHLHLSMDLNLPAYCAFVHPLLSRCSAQLTSVVCKSMLFLDTPANIMLLDSQKLSRLELDNLPTSFSLAHISRRYNSDKNLAFPNLHTLCLHFRDLPVDAEKELRIDTLESLLEQPNVGTPPAVLPVLNAFEISSFNFATLCRLFGRGGYVWSNVRSLKIAGHSELPRRDSISRNTHESMAHRLVSNIVRAMPCITKLHLSSESFDSSSAPAYYTHLVSALVNQLVHIDIRSPILLPFPCFFSQLTYLRVTVNTDVWLQFPRINSSTLRHLHLEDVPVGHFWSQIIKHSEFGHVTFDCLESLVVMFDDTEISQSTDCMRFVNARSNTSHVEVAFPRLVSVEITNGCYTGFQSILNGLGPALPSLHRLVLSFRNRDYGSGVWYNANANDSDSDGNNTGIYHKFIHALDLYLCTLVEQFPNVVHMRLAGSTLFSSHSRFFSALANTYAAQLVHFVCNIPISLTTHKLAHYLRILAISSYPNSGLLLPKINPENLVTLHLTSVSTESMWNSFESFDGNVGFSNLESMHLSIYASSEESDGLGDTSAPISICAPVLKYLSLEFSGTIYTCQAFVKLKDITKIVLMGAFSGIACVANGMEANSVNELNIKVNSFVDSDEDMFYTVTNRLLGSSDRFRPRSSAISLPPMAFALNAELIKWSTLTDLCITKTEFVIVTKLLPRLSSLVKFTYSDIPTDFTPDLDCLIISDDASVQSDNPQMLSETIKSLTIKTFPAPQDYDSVIACCTYLLALIPSLISAEVNGPRSWNLGSVISRFTDMYPHILCLGHRISSSR